MLGGFPFVKLANLVFLPHADRKGNGDSSDHRRRCLFGRNQCSRSEPGGYRRSDRCTDTVFDPGSEPGTYPGPFSCANSHRGAPAGCYTDRNSFSGIERRYGTYSYGHSNYDTNTFTGADRYINTDSHRHSGPYPNSDTDADTGTVVSPYPVTAPYRYASG